ncbi:hypothetical protein GCM10025795_45010 [Verticiella sediminum]
MTWPPNLQNITLPVTGMNCGGCGGSVDEAVRALSGIADVQALAAFGLLPPIHAAALQSIPDIGILAHSSRLLRNRETANG